MRDIHDQTYYELLEIEPSATQEEILKAYNRARATYGHNSPALYSLFNKEEAQELLKLIDEAYAVLSNQFKRRQYDSAKIGGISSGTAATIAAPEKQTGESMAIPSAGIDDTSFAIPSASSIPGFADTPAPQAQPAPATSTVSASASDEAPHRRKADAPRPQPPETTKSESAAGMGTTPFGNYVIDPLFEDEIKRTEEFNGAVIQRIRLYKNISLDQICENTKINRPYLIAVEASNYTSLPAPVFVRGFIVQIAKILGLDPAKVSTSYVKLLKEAQKK